MIALARAELYRLGTIQAWWLSLLAAGMLTGLAAVSGADWAWVGLVGMVTFLAPVVGVGQHYQHRTAALTFLAQPRRLGVLCGQSLAYASLGTAFAIGTGLPLLLTGGGGESYLATVLAVPFLAVFGVASAQVLRRPIWIIAGFGAWFFTMEGFAGRLELPGPFTGYLRWSAQQSPLILALLAWSAVGLVAAGLAIERDVDDD